MSGYFLSSCVVVVVVVVILHAQIYYVASPENDKLLHLSSVASQKGRMRNCDDDLQNNCVLVSTPVMKRFNILKHLTTSSLISRDVYCVNELV